MVGDAALPAVDDLLGDGAGALLARTLAGIAEVEGWRRTQVSHRPGHSITVRYGVRTRWPDGSRRTDTLVAQQTVEELPHAVTVLGHGTGTVAVWLYPFDPYLPGLARAASREPIATLLGALDGPDLAMLPRTYRPGRRALLEARGDDGTARCFVKVMRPRRAARIHATHRALAAHGLEVPRPLAADESRGLLLLAPLGGTTLREALLRGDPLPAPHQLVDFQKRLAQVALPLTRTPLRPLDPVGHAVALRALLDGQGPDPARIAAVAMAAVEGEPPVTTHGDLYEAQLMVTDGRLSGVLDLDGAGPGPIVDDCATVVAHLAVLARWRPAGADAIRAWMEGYLEAVPAIADPARVRRRAAGALLGLAIGPFRTCEPGWRREVLARLDAAAALAGAA